MKKQKQQNIGFQVPGFQTPNGYPGGRPQEEFPNMQGGFADGALPDFSRMTKQELKQFDDTEGSYKRLLGGKPITWFWLMNHYSKPNAAAYKRQKALAKAEKQQRGQQEQWYIPPEEFEGQYEEQRYIEQKPIMEQERVYPIPESTAENYGATVIIQGTSGQTEEKSVCTLDCIGFDRVVDIKKFPFRIGRNAECVDLCIADNPVVSAVHAEITAQFDTFYITDLNSTNHVYINEMEIPPQRKVALVDGDHITLGSEKFVFHINEQAQRI